MNYITLKERHRAERNDYPQSTSLRVHRALSWLDRAERCEDDPDAQFIFLWIAFNAAYATTFDDEPNAVERRRFSAFIQQLVQLDEQRQVYAMLWTSYADSIRILLQNQYVFPDFWRYQSGGLSEPEWRERFTRARRDAHERLANSDTAGVLGIVLQRIYTLRNQLVHGGATWNGSVNRPQVRDCTRFMAKLVPVILNLMMDHPHAAWGSVAYPVVDGAVTARKPARANSSKTGKLRELPRT